MASLNRVFLMGNLTRDPELRYTQSGLAVCDFGLAINRKFTGRDGQKKEDTCFVDITVWGKQAEVACEYLSKGRQVFIEGRLKFDTWEKDGQKRSKLSVVAQWFQFLGPQVPERPASTPSGAEKLPPSKPVPPEVEESVGEEDIPF